VQTSKCHGILRLASSARAALSPSLRDEGAMIRKALAAAAALFSISAAASAEPINLSCQASGAAGSVSFTFMFDEASQQSTASWNVGGGRPSAPVFGETGSDNAVQTSISMNLISGSFRSTTGMGDPYNYQVIVDRTSGHLNFTRGISRDPWLLTSSGTCQRVAPQRAF
jgi:hypothetical protein